MLDNYRRLPKDENEAMQVIAKLKFRKFDEHDWQMHLGCESKEPLINEDDLGYMVTIIDGRKVYFTIPVYDAFDDDGDAFDIANFELKGN